jgi:hypothetical protein
MFNKRTWICQRLFSEKFPASAIDMNCPKFRGLMSPNNAKGAWKILALPQREFKEQEESRKSEIRWRVEHFADFAPFRGPRGVWDTR